MNKKYINSKKAREQLNVCNKTLRNWAENGKIDYIRTSGGFRRYNINEYLELNNLQLKKNICYARVSTYEQKNDLSNQIKTLIEKYPNYEIIKDIGSGINFKRPGLLKIIKMAINNEIGELVITYKDRLCRIGFDLIAFILKQYSNAKIIILYNKIQFPQEVITEDLIEIITVYGAKIHSSRAKANRKKTR